MLYWILIGIFPARKTLECLKKPVKGETRHWCIFWGIYSILLCFNPLLSYLPFFSVISTFLILSNYNQHISELTLKGCIGLYRFIYIRIKNHDFTIKVTQKIKIFYNNNYLHLNKIIYFFSTFISILNIINNGLVNIKLQGFDFPDTKNNRIKNKKYTDTEDNGDSNESNENENNESESNESENTKSSKVNTPKNKNNSIYSANNSNIEAFKTDKKEDKKEDKVESNDNIQDDKNSFNILTQLTTYFQNQKNEEEFTLEF